MCRIKLKSSVLIPFLFALRCDAAAGQELWSELTAIGYGGLGVVAGLAAAEPDENGLILAGALLGMIVGSRIGGSAESMSEEGDLPGRLHLVALRLGVVSAGGTIGAAAGGLLTRDGDGTRNLDSGWAVLVGAAVGATAATVYQLTSERRGSAESGPRLLVRPAPRGGGWQVGLQL